MGTETEQRNFPQAKVRKDGRHWLVWLAPLFAIAMVAFLVWKHTPATGPEIEILLLDGSGIRKNQTQIVYLGVPVGIVSDVSLDKDSGKVKVVATMQSDVEHLLKEHTQFWVVRPEIGLSGIQGLDTLITGPYLVLSPGDGKPRTQFSALKTAPSIGDQSTGLNIVLKTAQLGSLSIGTPITYRGIEVGEIYQYQLQSDSRRVRLFVHINEPYVPLVRNNSVFWNNGGLDVDVSLFGAEVKTDSLTSLLTGSIAFATPNASEEIAPTGTQFMLAKEPDEDWLKWEPVIQITAPAIEQQSATDSPLQQMRVAKKPLSSSSTDELSSEESSIKEPAEQDLPRKNPR